MGSSITDCPTSVPEVGTRYEYSNIGSDVAGYLLETTGDQALDDHSDHHIFEPLGMNHTGWHLADHEASNVALPIFGLTVPSKVTDITAIRTTLVACFARVPEIWADTLAAYANGALDGVRILESSTVDEIFAAQIPSVDPTQGVFWYWEHLEGRDVVAHSGGDYGVSTKIMLDVAAGIGVVVLLNTYGDNAVWAAQTAIERAFLRRETPCLEEDKVTVVSLTGPKGAPCGFCCMVGHPFMGTCKRWQKHFLPTGSCATHNEEQSKPSQWPTLNHRGPFDRPG